jgi:hypothetical protein
VLFETLEAEYLEKVRRKVILPRVEARARLQRELALLSQGELAPKAPRRSWRCWAATARLRLGIGLMAAGVWLAGRRGDLL